MTTNRFIEPGDKPDFAEPSALSERAARDEASELAAALRHHDHRYYVLDDPGIADGLYDVLLRRLVALEEAFPALLTPDSPTQRVGGGLLETLGEVEHTAPMLSLDSGPDAEQVREFDARARKALDIETIDYVAEPKFDGISMEVVFEDGRFVRAATRGDGIRGEDVTENVRTIRALPLRLVDEARPAPQLLAVRAEVLIPLDGFLAMNRARIEAGAEPFANPRNATAGAIRQLDTSAAARRPLDLFFYDVLASDGVELPPTHSQTLDWLRAWGLKVSRRTRSCHGIEEAITYHDELEAGRDELPYEIDGVVVKIDRRDWQIELGARSRTPRWAFAHKFAPREEVTRIEDIALQVGRTGIIAPVALLAPVEVGGVTIARASLHNYDQVRAKDIRPGDSVRVHRAGDVIPYVVERVDDRPESERAAPFEMPTECPVCGSHVERDGAYFVCTGGISCPAQLAGAIEHWGSRHALDIEGLGSKTVRQLAEAGLLTESVADLYRLRKDQLLPLELFGETKAGNLVDAIERSKTPALGRLIYAFGIRHVGDHVADVLAREFRSLEALIEADEERLLAVHEVGPQVAHNVIEFFGEPRNRRVVDELQRLGLQPVIEAAAENAALAGQRFVLTGALSLMSRTDAAAHIEHLGGRVTSSVSAKTDYVVVGDSPGSKADKAAKLGVTVLDEKAFVDLLSTHGVTFEED